MDRKAIADAVALGVLSGKSFWRTLQVVLLFHLCKPKNDLSGLLRLRLNCQSNHASLCGAMASFTCLRCKARLALETAGATANQGNPSWRCAGFDIPNVKVVDCVPLRGAEFAKQVCTYLRLGCHGPRKRFCSCQQQVNATLYCQESCEMYTSRGSLFVLYVDSAGYRFVL